jgi:glycerophosphoryl diester phosphodiesterase
VIYMIIFAHRGARGYAPENTMAAFYKALEIGADGIELDVQMSRDGIVVICHDHDIDRTSDGHGWIKDLTVAELKQYDFGRWFDERYSGETIPTLNEFLAWLRPTPLLLNIEIKNGLVVYEGIEAKVVDAITQFGLKERVIISSFFHPSLVNIKELDPSIKTGALFASRPVDPVRICMDTGSNFLHPYWHFLDKTWVGRAKSLGIGVNTYTVNTPEVYRYVKQSGVDGVFSDYPDIVNRT